MRKLILIAFEFGFIMYLLGVCTNKYINYTVSSQLYSDLYDLPEKEYALVLGCAKHTKNGINPFFKERLDAAAALYFSQKVKKIIVSGNNHKLGYNEPADMTLYLQEKGIPSAAIIQDFAGFRTLDSVVRAKKVFKCQDLIIVSQKSHNQRAIYIANKQNMNAVAFNATFPKNYTLYNVIREYFAKILMVGDIYLFKTNPKFY